MAICSCVTFMQQIHSRCWSLPLAVILVLLNLHGVPNARAIDLRVAAEAAAAKATIEQKTLLLALESNIKIGERIKLIRKLSLGFVVSPRNPLRLDGVSEANAKLQALIETAVGDDKLKAEKVLYEFLGRSKLKIDREKAEGMLAKQPLLAEDPILLLDANRTRLDNKQVADLKLLLQQGFPSAGFILADFYQKSNAAEAKIYRDHALYLATLNAQSSPSAAMFLASIYIDGRAGKKNAENAMEALALAVSNGSDTALGVMDSHYDDPLFSEHRPRMKALIESALISGSDLAAEMLILDQSSANRYGFTAEEAIWALGLLEEIKSQRAIYVKAKLYAEGRLLQPDMQKANALLAELSDVSAYVDEYQFAVGKQILRIDMLPKYQYAYALPIFLDLVDSRVAGVINRVSTLTSNAIRDGYFASTTDLPINPDLLLSKLRQTYGSGDWSSGLVLGDIFRQGLIVPQNLAMANQYYREVSNKSSDLSQVLQADESMIKILLGKTTTEQDQIYYRDKLRSLSERGSLWAKKEYGSMLLAKTSDKADNAQVGVELLFQAVEANYLSASGRILKYALENKRIDLQQRLTSLLEQMHGVNPSRAMTLELAQVYGSVGRADDGISLLKQRVFEEDPEAIFITSKIGLEAKQIPHALAFAEIRRAISLTAPTNIQLIKYARFILFESMKDGIIDASALEIVSRFADRGNSDAVELGLKYSAKEIADSPERLGRVIDWVANEAKNGRPELLLTIAEKQLGQNAGQENNAKIVKAIADNLDKMEDRGSARNILSIAYRNGFGVAVDPKKAKIYQQEAAVLGSPSALYDLGISYLYGIDEERDLLKAESLIAAASLFKSNKALIAKGRLKSSAFGSSFNEFQAFASNKEAADAGSLAGMVETGRAYLAGSGVEKDTAMGLMWLETAAGKGSPFAASQLYFYYVNQDASVQNEKARYWLDRAIASGHSPSLVRKAALLETQDPVTNANEIQALLDQSIAEGHNLSRRYKAKIAKDKLKQ